MKTLLTIVAFAVLTTPSDVSAQGTTYFSNVDAPTGSHVDIGSDFWGAAWFRTGSEAGGYTLDSIQLLMGNTVGSPSGLSVMLWNFQTAQPILTLVGPSPSVAGVYTFSAPSFVMPPNTVYWFVTTSQTSSANGQFAWRTTSQNVLGNQWIGGGFQASSDGVNWARESGRELQFAVNAQAIPEPSSSTLITFGLATLFALGEHLRRRTLIQKRLIANRLLRPNGQQAK